MSDYRKIDVEAFKHRANPGMMWLLDCLAPKDCPVCKGVCKGHQYGLDDTPHSKDQDVLKEAPKECSHGKPCKDCLEAIQDALPNREDLVEYTPCDQDCPHTIPGKTHSWADSCGCPAHNPCEHDWTEIEGHTTATHQCYKCYKLAILQDQGKTPQELPLSEEHRHSIPPKDQGVNQWAEDVKYLLDKVDSLKADNKVMREALTDIGHTYVKDIEGHPRGVFIDIAQDALSSLNEDV